MLRLSSGERVLERIRASVDWSGWQHYTCEGDSAGAAQLSGRTRDIGGRIRGQERGVKIPTLSRRTREGWGTLEDWVELSGENEPWLSMKFKASVVRRRAGRIRKDGEPEILF